MRSWTTAAMRGALLAGLVYVVAGCGSAPPPPSPPLPGTSIPMAVQQAVRPLRLVLGDTVRLRFRGGTSPRLAVHGGPGGATANFVSNLPAVATVTNDGLVTAVSLGNANISAVAPTTPGASAMVPVQIVSRRQATNMMANEVCPNTDESFIEASLPVGEEVTRIHEYHDCQRLIEDSQYGPLVGIFAHLNVAHHTDWVAWKDGRLAAIIVNFAGNKTPVAYASLGIEPGTNCLVLKADSQEDWQALVVSQSTVFSVAGGGRNYGQCDESLTWASAKALAHKELSVKRQHGVDMKGNANSPPVARWDWDSVSRRNYIGIRCDAQTWCDVGPKDFVPSTPMTVRFRYVRFLPVPYHTEPILKGYYDQQFLANAAGDAPSSVFGTIRPGSDARSRDDIDVENSRWYEVARLEFADTLRPTSPDYAHYVRGYKDPTTATPASEKTSTRYRLRPVPNGGVGNEYDGDFDQKPLKKGGIQYHFHTDILHDGPPVVRWRWQTKDEGTWTFCPPDGCCENKAVLTDQE